MKKIISLVCLICLLFSYSVYADTTINSTFTDVPKSHWAKAYIDSFVKSGVVAGYTDGTFKPENNVTREEFCKLLVKSFNADKEVNIQSTTQTFADVGYDRWSYKDVELSREFLTGYINPFGGKPLFKPTNIATREDIAVALVKMLGYSENDVSSYGSYVSKFNDSQTISPNLRNYVGFAVSTGLINGYPDGSFGAQRGITRAETLALLDRALKVSIAEEYEDFDFKVNTVYRNEGQTVDIEVVSNYRVTVTINGETLTLTDGSGHTNKFARTYTYSFEKEGEKEFIIEAKHGNIVKKEVVKTEYRIGTPKIKITDIPSKVYTKSAAISGEVSCEGVNGYDINFTINDKRVDVIANNRFYYTYTLEDEGINTIVFKAEYKGKEARVEREIEYITYSPEIEIFSCPEKVNVNKVILSGAVSDKNYTKHLWAYVSLMINDKKVSIDSQGLFTTEVNLQEGINEIVLIAKNDKGKTTRIDKEVIYTVDRVEVEEEEVKEYTAPTLIILDYPKTTQSALVRISGRVTDENVKNLRDIFVIVDGEKAIVDKNGFWSSSKIIDNGVNIITIIASNEFGKTTEQEIEITYNR